MWRNLGSELCLGLSVTPSPLWAMQHVTHIALNMLQVLKEEVTEMGPGWCLGRLQQCGEAHHHGNGNGQANGFFPANLVEPPSPPPSLAKATVDSGARKPTQRRQELEPDVRGKETDPRFVASSVVAKLLLAPSDARRQQREDWALRRVNPIICHHQGTHYER